jgi:hypothetical protein
LPELVRLWIAAGSRGEQGQRPARQPSTFPSS